MLPAVYPEAAFFRSGTIAEMCNKKRHEAQLT